MKQPINRTIIAAVAVILLSIAAIIFFLSGPLTGGSRPPAAGGPTDPQQLYIPRWFMRELIVDGVAHNVPEQAASIQFSPDGQAGGQGGCNSFGAEFKAGRDGSIGFGPAMSTQMACDQNMDLESAYLGALPRIQRYQVEDGTLTLTSADGQVTMVFGMPPK